jgi:hypothetical protein
MLGVTVLNELTKLRHYRSFGIVYLLFLIVVIGFAILISNDSMSVRIASTTNEVDTVKNYFVGYYFLLCIAGSIALNLFVLFLFKMESDGLVQYDVLLRPVNVGTFFVGKLFAAFVVNTLTIFSGAVVILAVSFAKTKIHEGVDFDLISSSEIIFRFSLRYLILSGSITTAHVLLCLLVHNKPVMLVLSIVLPIVSLFNGIDVLPYGWPARVFFEDLKFKTSHDVWPALFNSSFELLSFFSFMLFAALCYLFNSLLHRSIKI